MPTSDIPRFRAAIARALELADIRETVASGPFVIDVHIDRASRDLGVLSALERATGDGLECQSTVAILAGPQTALQDVLPPDRTRRVLMENPDFYALWMPFPDNALFLYDIAHSRGLMWLPEQTAPAWLLSRPMLPLLHAHASAGPWCPVHAASVGVDGRFLLLIGAGGSGKTTAALACGALGWQYAGDDFVMINPAESRVLPLFSSGRLRLKGGNALDNLLGRHAIATSREDADPRRELRLGRDFANWAIAGGDVEAILVLRRQGKKRFDTGAVRAADVFGAMLSATRACAPGLSASLTRKLLAASRMAPALSVDTGDDPLAISDGLRRFLDREPA